MNHKRRRVKSRRAGCLLCKPHKHQSTSKTKRLLPRDERRPQIAELREHLALPPNSI